VNFSEQLIVGKSLILTVLATQNGKIVFGLIVFSLLIIAFSIDTLILVMLNSTRLKQSFFDLGQKLNVLLTSFLLIFFIFINAEKDLRERLLQFPSRRNDL
jgi:hypothetical protein